MSSRSLLPWLTGAVLAAALGSWALWLLWPGPGAAAGGLAAGLGLGMLVAGFLLGRRQVSRGLGEGGDGMARDSATLEQALQEARRSNRLKDSFLAMVSHELRTPMQATLGWAELLRRHPPDWPQAGQACEQIIHNVHVQSRMIDDLLDVSHILAGQLRLELQSTDATAAVQRAIEILRMEAEARGIRLELQCPDTPIWMVTDASRLEQLTWNLVRNAVHASPDHGRVEVRLEVREQLMCLRVRDWGEGIERERMPELFEAFGNGADLNTPRHGGLGLGLSITRNIVSMFHGRVWASSDGAGHGACFHVQLPLHAHAAHAPSPDAPLQDGPPCESLRVSG